jgi:hypothetical protein
MRVTIATSAARPDEPNEDFAAAGTNGVILLDGAGLSGTTSKCTHGVAWYTRHLGGALLAGLPDEERTLTAILRDGIRETAALHAGTCDLDDPGTPSATVVMVRLTGDRIQYLVLADSVLVLARVGRPPTVITDNRADDAGRSHRAAMDAAVNGTAQHDEARRQYVQTMRGYRNRTGGFWVAASDPAAADEALTGDGPLDGAGPVALLSDGASRIADSFHLADWPQVLVLLDTHGPDEVIRRVRRAEDDDPHGAKWPRAKAHDDATIAYCTDLRGDRQANRAAI